MKRNPFAVLGFSETLVSELRDNKPMLKKICDSHKKFLAAINHPDKTMGGPEKTAEITEAYERLWGSDNEFEDLADDFLRVKPLKLENVFLKKEVSHLKKKKSELEERALKAEAERNDGLDELESKIKTLQSKLFETFNGSIFPLVVKNKETLNSLPSTFVLVTRDLPGSHNANFFLVHENKIYNEKIFRTQGSREAVSVDEGVKRISENAQPLILNGKFNYKILGCMDEKHRHGMKSYGHVIEKNIYQDDLLSLLIKIETKIRIGAVLFLAMRRKDDYLVALSPKGYIDSIHPVKL